MSNTPARPALPSLQSLAFPSLDRSRANAGSSHDAGNLEFSKLLQKALTTPDAVRDAADAPPERDAISIETLSMAQGFTVQERMSPSEPMAIDSMNPSRNPQDGNLAGAEADSSCGNGPGGHEPGGQRADSPTPTEAAAASAAQPSPTQPTPSGAAAPVAPSSTAPSETPTGATPSAAGAASTPSAPTTSPLTPELPATTPGSPVASEPTALIDPLDAAQTAAPTFADLLEATGQRGSTASAASQPAAASTAPVAHVAPDAPGAQPLATPAEISAVAKSAATKSVDVANSTTPSTSAASPALAPIDGNVTSATKADAATAAAANATSNTAVSPPFAATLVAATAQTTPSPATSKGTATANRIVAAEMAATTAAETAPAMIGGARATLATEATEPTLRAGAHPPAALTAQLSQDAVQIPATTPPAPSTPNLQPIPIPTSAALTNEALDAPVIVTEGIDAAAARAEPTGREAMVPGNASPISNEQTVARAQRAALHPAVAQVAVSVTKAVQEGVDRITIKLQPPELGRIDVRIDVGVDGRIQAVFAAERPATIEILQRDVRELERALQNAGLSADSGSLSFGLKQQGGGRYTPFAGGTGGDVPVNDLDVTGDTLVARNAAARRADGHLDIHV